jgi:hypothetical protein
MILIKIDFHSNREAPNKDKSRSTMFSVGRNVGTDRNASTTFDAKILRRIDRRTAGRKEVAIGSRSRNCRSRREIRNCSVGAGEEGSAAGSCNLPAGRSSNTLRNTVRNRTDQKIRTWRSATPAAVVPPAPAAFSVDRSIQVPGIGVSSVDPARVSAVRTAFRSEASTSGWPGLVRPQVWLAVVAPTLWNDAKLASCRRCRLAGTVGRVPRRPLKNKHKFLKWHHAFCSIDKLWNKLLAVKLPNIQFFNVFRHILAKPIMTL